MPSFCFSRSYLVHRLKKRETDLKPLDEFCLVLLRLNLLSSPPFFLLPPKRHNAVHSPSRSFSCQFSMTPCHIAVLSSGVPSPGFGAFPEKIPFLRLPLLALHA